MKKVSTFFFFATLLFQIAFNQVPQAMNYQAVARDAGGGILANTNICVQSTITDGNGGSILYQETFNITTNQFGLFTLQIGMGSAPTGNYLSNINWSAVAAWHKIEIQIGCTGSYVLMGSSQLLSVPYALYAANGPAGPTGATGATGQMGSNGDTGPTGTNGTAGTNGTNGVTGATGPTGINGINGAIGVTGPTGANGINGSIGVTGPTGATGTAGSLPNGNAAGNTTYWNGSTWVVNSSNIYNNGGDIGINTSSPAGKLHIQGSANVSQLIIDANATQSNNNPLIKLRNTSGDLLWIHSNHSSNVFVGKSSGSATTGINNTYIGSSAGLNNTAGHDNTANGFSALQYNTTGNNNVANGSYALFGNGAGNGNTAIGNEALFSNNLGGNFNTACGLLALYTNAAGNYNTANGVNALYYNSAGSKATAIGYNAMFYANNTTTAFDNYNVAVGCEALRGSTTASANTGNYNTALGYQSLLGNSSGSANIAVGYNALYSNINGGANTAIGNDVLKSNSSGYQNVALGTQSMQFNTNGYDNTATGVMSMRSNTTGDSNTGIGSSALYGNTTGYQNTATGFQAMQANTVGNNNTAHGKGALYSNTSGVQNTALGSNSLLLNSTGNYNTAVGYNTGPNSGNLANTNCFGIDATGTATDQVRVGNVFINSIGGQVGWTTLSDARFKENVKSNVPGLSFINQLNPVTYQVNRDKVNAFTGVKPSMTGETMSGVTTGFIAQEVEAAAKEVGFDFSGVDAPKNENDYYGLRYAEFVVPLVKGMQELNQKSEEQQKMIAAQNKLIAELKKAIELLMVK